MALHRQGSVPWQVGLGPSVNGDLKSSGSKPGSPYRLHDHLKAEHLGLLKSRSFKAKRGGRLARSRHCSIGAVVVVLLVVFLFTIFGADYVFPVIRNLRGESGFSGLPDATDSEGFFLTGLKDLTRKQDNKVSDAVSDPKFDGEVQEGARHDAWSSISTNKSSSAVGRNYTEQANHDDENVHNEEEEEEDVEPKSTKRKKRKRSAPPCEIPFLNSTQGLREPTDVSRFHSFSLDYLQKEEKPEGVLSWEPRFAGHQTLQEREESFVAKDQTVNCGFVTGPEEFPSTGFDLSKEDMDYLQTCHIAVSSCIFGNYDHIRTPPGKKVSGSSKKKVCFAMFVDQASLDGMIEEGEVPDENGNLGLWRIVTIKNLPYTDNRRTGKVPKFLTHRLFPNARYSIWLDSKLRLQSDPLLILEYFLWRGGYEYAISNHYDRHCVWEEVEQNKKLNKFNFTVIDEQFAFYQEDGLTRFNASDPNKLLPSHVPEGSFIVRAHTPMSNLFSCLWFNEVDRFTSRDQLSFAYTFLKFVRTNPAYKFRFNMFKDCERKSMVKLYRHKQEEVLLRGRRH